MSSLCYRIVERQATVYEYEATSDDVTAQALQDLIETTKPKPFYTEWHDLIATAFRYPLPVGEDFAARFRPAGSDRNALYASEYEVTALFEHAYHFLKFRAGLKKLKRAGQRTIFGLKILDSRKILDLSQSADVDKISDPRDYRSSYKFIERNPDISVIKYPSCRDPERRSNFCVRDIAALSKNIAGERTISFSLSVKRDGQGLTLTWLDFGLSISWSMFENS